ncbi:MAG: DNA polymerase IV [Clostridia bacterium]|nr:DNA polymerase IV [Clostridia bacterium]
MPGDRVILHCDCNNFYASVELLSRPDLRDVPMAVGGDTSKRHGIILAKNMPAKRLGILTAMTVYQAVQICPDLVLLPPHHHLYHEISQKINRIYLSVTDQVEPFSVDESFLDVTGSVHLFGDGVQIADMLRRRIREEIGITISAGVSFNKPWAKMGSDYRKPDATTLLDRETAPVVLFPQSVDNMLFVGKRTAEVLKSQGINTIGDLVASGPEALERLLGKAGPSLYTSAAGLDTSPVRVWGDTDPAKSISHAQTYARDLLGEDDWSPALLELSEEVGSRLRRAHLKARSVSVQIKSPDLKVQSRQTTLDAPTASTDRLYRTACELLRSAGFAHKPIRLLSLQASLLMPEDEDVPLQMSLFDEPRTEDPRRLQLEKTIDALRDRFGTQAVTRGKVTPPAGKK